MTRAVAILAACLFAVFFTAGVASASVESDSIHACLRHWGKTPFMGQASPAFKTLKAPDLRVTDGPELVLVRPGAASPASSTSKKLKLLNPNGWYCLEGMPAELGAGEIELNCKANLASSAITDTIFGSYRIGAVPSRMASLGPVKVKRIGCGAKP